MARGKRRRRQPRQSTAGCPEKGLLRLRWALPKMRHRAGTPGSISTNTNSDQSGPCRGPDTHRSLSLGRRGRSSAWLDIGRDCRQGIPDVGYSASRGRSRSDDRRLLIRLVRVPPRADLIPRFIADGRSRSLDERSVRHGRPGVMFTSFHGAGAWQVGSRRRQRESEEEQGRDEHGSGSK